VVATPEQVSFRLETAGLGSRFVAQLIDVLAFWGLLIALGLVSAGIAGFLHAPTAAVIVLVVAGFALFCGYWILPEALWSGRTLGKRALHLRVVDAGGGPISAGQAIVRNLFRIVDFLPANYAVGVVAIFASRRNQRLGDMAAGTVVVRERMAVRLSDLAAVAGGQGRSGPPPPAWTVRLDPALRRFVVAYAQRRAQLHLAHREELARLAEPALRAVLPDVVAARGPLAALDHLADTAI